MFRVNDVIIYGAQGVCQIVEIGERAISGAKKNYYILKPVKDPSSTIYAPTDNEHVLKKMRKLLTRQEIDALIDSMPAEETDWIGDNDARKTHYKAVLASGDHSALIRMIKTLYAHKKGREAEGKRLHMVDEQLFREAEQILYEEFQYVLQLGSKDDLMAYVLDRLGE